MGNLRAIDSVNPAELIANGLTELAEDVRSGKINALRVGVVFSSRVPGKDEDQVAFCFYGAQASSAEMVGLLAQCQFELMSQS